MLFSVIIPTHHRTRGITHALSSLMLQTHPHWEAIIVDNELEEKNNSPIHPLQSEDRRIRYLKKPYRNLGEARAWGISAARGDIITFIEGNDYFSPTHLQVHHDIFQSSPRLDMVLGKPTIIGSPYIEDTHIHQSPVHGTFFIREHVFDTIQQLPGAGLNEDQALYDQIRNSGFVTKKIAMPTYVYDRTHHLYTN